jgi:hypothetical protein
MSAKKAPKPLGAFLFVGVENVNGNGKVNGKQHQHGGAQPTAAPCTSPWTEAYQTAPEWQRPAEDQDCQPTLDALSHIYNRGYA